MCVGEARPRVNTAGPRICFVAAPLVTAGGVFRSTIELVEGANAAGLDWSAHVGSRLPLEYSGPCRAKVHLFRLERRGPAGIVELARSLDGSLEQGSYDLLVALIPQTDQAFACLSALRRIGPWVSFLRALPWPGEGEDFAARRHAWRVVEKVALRFADDVWVTTPTLMGQVGLGLKAIVPAGVARIESQPESFDRQTVSFAARLSRDKNPMHYLDIMRELPDVSGYLFGDGPLRDEVLACLPPNVTWRRWAEPRDIWSSTGVFVGTSTREAFGRGAVEAAMSGIPCVLTTEYGVAEFLYRDPTLRSRAVLPIGAPASRWAAIIRELLTNKSKYDAVRDHLQCSAEALTIQSSIDSISSRATAVLETVSSND